MRRLMVAAMLAGAMVASAEDPYIESDGTQFLNTGYCVCTNTRIELDVQMLEIGLDKYMLSSSTGDQDGYKDNIECNIYLGGYAGSEKFSFSTSTNGVLSSGSSSGLRKGNNLYLADTNRHVIVVDYTLPSEHFQVLNDKNVSDETKQRILSKFFDEVMVMDKDDAVRGNRIALLKKCNDLLLTAGDLSVMA